MNRNHVICLIRINSEDHSRSTCVDAERFTIGRVGADLTLSDKGISRIHLTVHVRGTEIWLEDMGSANGTYLAGMKIQAQSPVQYKVGTLVQLGVSKDTLSFELVEKTLTLEESEAENQSLTDSPSKALSNRAPTLEIAAQADAFLKEAREAAAAMKVAAARESETLLDDARTKANEALSRARAEAETLLEAARNTANQSVLDREAAAEATLANARKEALQIKTLADEEAERVNKDARLMAGQIKLQAQKEAEEALHEARTRASEVKDRAEAEAIELVRQTREKNRAAIEQNEADIEKALVEARAASAQIRAEADSVLLRARAYIQEKGNAIIQDAQAQAERIHQEAVANAGRVRDEARAEGLRTIESGLREAELEIERVKEASRGEIDSLQERKKQLEQDISEVERRKSDIVALTEERRAESAEAESARDKIGEEIATLQAEQQKAKAELALSVTLRETAERERDEAMRVRKAAENEAEKLRRETNESRTEIAKELKEMREKGLLEFQERRRQEDAEIANLKLKWIEDMKVRQVEEEKQRRVLRGHQAVEMARHLEILLVPKIQNRFPDQDTTPILAELQKELPEMVKRVILEEQGMDGGSEIEHVISSDPVIEKMRKRELLHNRLMFAVPTALLVLAVFVPHLFDWARRPIDMMNGGKTLADIMRERHEELTRRMKYEPPQKDEIGPTYTDSVLFTRNYVDRKLDENIQAAWITELNKHLLSEGLPDQAIVDYIAAETVLIKDLKELRDNINPEFEKEGIKKLRDREAEALAKMIGKVGGDIAYDKIRVVERNFLSEQFRSPSSKE